MKRSEINHAYREALEAFSRAGWAIPPRPCWDITDFGRGDFGRCGLTVINLAEEPEYSEKLLYMRVGQTLPVHTHGKKKEDIICRHGRMTIAVWAGLPSAARGTAVRLKRSGEWTSVPSGVPFEISAGERVTLVPGVYHSFSSVQEGTVIGEVSTANDDLQDNFFAESDMARFPVIDEDEPPLVKLVSDR
jgi:D-lyxose ketol-isomerase